MTAWYDTALFLVAVRDGAYRGRMEIRRGDVFMRDRREHGSMLWTHLRRTDLGGYHEVARDLTIDPSIEGFCQKVGVEHPAVEPEGVAA